MDADQTLNILIAAGEALANAIEHGHRHYPGGTVTLRATHLADRVDVSHGHRLVEASEPVGESTAERRSPHAGPGHDVTIRPRPTGTTVR